MQLIPRLVSFSGLIFVVLVTSAGLSYAQTGAEVLEIVLSQRRQITSGLLVCESKYTNFGGQFQANTTQKVWFNGNRLRFDVVRDGFTRSVCFDCYDGNHVLYEIGLNNTPTLTVYEPRHVSRQTSPMLVPDIRFLGLITSDLLIGSTAALDTNYLPDAAGVAFGPTSVEYQGHPIGELNFRNTNGLWSIRVVKDLNFAVRSVRHVDISGLYVAEVVSELQEIPQLSMWYPTIVEFVEIANGAPCRAQHLEIKTCELGAKIDDQVFSIGGMDHVKSGTPVIWYGPRVEEFSPPIGLEWDGKKLVRSSAAAKSDNQPSIAAGSSPEKQWISSNVLFVSGAFILAFGLIGLILRARKSSA